MTRHQERQLIGNMLQALSAQLEQDGRNQGDAEKAAEYAKLAKELAAIFRKFQDAKRLEAKQEAFYAPIVLQQASLFTSRSKTNEAGINADQNSNLHDLLEKLKGMKALLLESENSLEEILRDGEEDEDEVHRIQGEINSLKAFINDYESLSKEQARGIDDIESSQQVSNVHQTLKHKNTIVRRHNLSFLWNSKSKTTMDLEELNGSLSQFNLITDDLRFRIRSVRFQFTTLEEV
ncbi:syntaxin-23-like [Eucalyptus grandis]|uniref:syntaxin-23-like n=1 Tax=Eucalyptus grandis TaxID=71139 RepID=UPI00192E8A5E|nr:syntaxin-23-like [Eucalyptus grandis]